VIDLICLWIGRVFLGLSAIWLMLYLPFKIAEGIYRLGGHYPLLLATLFEVAKKRKSKAVTGGRDA